MTWRDVLDTAKMPTGTLILENLIIALTIVVIANGMILVAGILLCAIYRMLGNAGVI